jgi:4-hydroxyphenylpyruvate dioxygenase-like putative hemolysin
LSGTDALRATRYLHTIHAAPSCERLRRLYCDVFGGIVFSENYYPPEDRDAALLYVADHMIEVMAPRHTDDLQFTYARYLAKTGPSYHSISFGVRDFAAALERTKAIGLQLSTVGPGLMFVHPKSSGGIIMELTDHRMPNDPKDLPNWRSDWAVGRPNRPHAIAQVVCAPRDPAAAVAFLVEVLGGAAGEPFSLAWPQAATATPVQVADATLLVLDLADRSAGPVARFVAGPNAGVYALAWKVADSQAAAAWFAQNDLPVERTAADAPWTHEAVVDGARHWLIQTGAS